MDETQLSQNTEEHLNNKSLTIVHRNLKSFKIAHLSQRSIKSILKKCQMLQNTLNTIPLDD